MSQRLFLEKAMTKVGLSATAVGLFLVLCPLLAFGAFSDAYITAVMKTVTDVVNKLIPIMIGLTFIYFAWCMIQYIRSSGDDKIKTKNSLVWSVIAVVLVVSIWGIVGLLQSIFGATTRTVPLPELPGLSAPATPKLSPEERQQLDALPNL